MLYEISGGGGLVIVLFAATSNAVSFAINGVGLAMGLSLGAGILSPIALGSC